MTVDQGHRAGRPARAGRRLAPVAGALLPFTLFAAAPALAQSPPPPALNGTLPPDADTIEPASPEVRARARASELEAIQRDMALSAKRQAEIEQEITALERDRTRLTQSLLDSAARLARVETDVAAARARLDDLAGDEDAIRLSLSERRGVIAEVLASLQRIGRRPPPALAVRPDDALAAVRSAILLGAVIPDLRVEAEALAADLAALERVKADRAAELARLRDDLALQTEERARVEMLITEKRQTEQSRAGDLVAEKKRAEELAANARSLTALLKDLGREIDAVRKAEEQAAKAEPGVTGPGRLAPAIAFASARGRLPQPVVGSLVRKFGASDATGVKAEGLSFSTAADAQVRAPADGWVDYAGPFRSYGQLLILNVGGGYHVLLAGMARIDVEMGQFVLAGEPVGRMGDRRLASAATLDIPSTRPVLYVEFRKDGSSIDPTPWWAGRTDEGVRG
ncbi:murein hydrolase activator EnvC family protein [Segnochrobactraceae bacterium EtOH-i3]